MECIVSDIRRQAKILVVVCRSPGRLHAYRISMTGQRMAKQNVSDKPKRLNLEFDKSINNIDPIRW